MSKITLTAIDKLAVAKPEIGKIAAFVDIADGRPKWMDSNGTIHDFAGSEFVEGWRKYTIDFDNAAFVTGTNSVVISVETSEPTNTVIVSTFKKHTVPFEGGGLTEVLVSVGYHSYFDTPYSVTQSVIPPKGFSESPSYEGVSTGDIDVTFAFTDGVDTDLTAGSVDIWIKTVTLP
jgi:hypothetical protein